VKPLQKQLTKNNSFEASNQLNFSTPNQTKNLLFSKYQNPPQKMQVNQEYGIFPVNNHNNPRSKAVNLKIDTNQSNYLSVNYDVHESLLLGDEENDRSRRCMKSPRVRSTHRLFDGKIPNRPQVRHSSINRNMGKEYTSEKIIMKKKIGDKMTQSLMIGDNLMKKFEHVEKVINGEQARNRLSSRNLPVDLQKVRFIRSKWSLTEIFKINN
jgi:hypothetical protein